MAHLSNALQLPQKIQGVLDVTTHFGGYHMCYRVSII